MHRSLWLADYLGHYNGWQGLPHRVPSNGPPLRLRPWAEAQARPVPDMQTYSYTMHEFLERYEILHQSAQREAAEQWQQRCGGGLWHIDARGTLRPGPPMSTAHAFLVARVR